MINNSYPPEDDISVMAARTPTAIIAKVNANSFSKIDMAENALIYLLLDVFLSVSSFLGGKGPKTRVFRV
jgi:hypothetical protein